MSKDLQPCLCEKPTPIPIQVIECADGYIEIFEKNMIGFGSVKPSEIKSKN